MEVPLRHQHGTAPLARLSRTWKPVCQPLRGALGFAAAWPTACFHAADFARCRPSTGG